MNQYLYVSYSIHRYAVIVDRESIFARFKEMPAILWSAFLSLIVTYGVNLENFFSRILFPLCLCMGCMWRCRIIVMVTFTAKLLISTLLASLQVFIVKSTCRKMAESKRFLLSLTRNEQIENRLLAISRMNRFNVKISIISAFPPSFNALHQLSDSLILFFLFPTTNKNIMKAYPFIFDSLDAFLQPTCSIIFVVLHVDRLRQFF